jgi:hypothetical protein
MLAVFDTKVERALAVRAIGYFASWEDEMINPMTGAKEPDADLEIPLRCPACLKIHKWKPRDAWTL